MDVGLKVWSFIKITTNEYQFALLLRNKPFIYYLNYIQSLDHCIFIIALKIYVCNYDTQRCVLKFGLSSIHHVLGRYLLRVFYQIFLNFQMSAFSDVDK